MSCLILVCVLFTIVIRFVWDIMGDNMGNFRFLWWFSILGFFGNFIIDCCVILGKVFVFFEFRCYYLKGE